MTAMIKSKHDAIVIGGGPAGSTAALVLARAGMNVIVLERAMHPRFHVGESFLPRNLALIRELGLEEKLNAIPHTTKLGAEFGFGHAEQPTTCFSFKMGLGCGETEAFNIERAPFDAMLLDAGREAGAMVFQEAQVKRILKLADGDVTVALQDGRELHAKFLIDASGQSTVVGRHLKTRRVLSHLQKVAYFAHFYGVKRLEGDQEGYPTIVMCREGWFWIIPLDRNKTSIGLVMDVHKIKDLNDPPAPEQMLRWGIERCPFMRQRAGDAVFPERNGVTADFSYRCEPYAGPGFFLIGDAATFVDPIFSTGVCLGMMSALEAANAIVAVVRHRAAPEPLRRRYIKFVQSSSSVFFKLVAQYYDHAFRELFLQGQGPLDMHRAVISTLAGHVFPKPAFAIRWRLQLFDLCIKLQRRWALAPRRGTFSLLEAPNSPPTLDPKPHLHSPVLLHEPRPAVTVFQQASVSPHDAARA